MKLKPADNDSSDSKTWERLLAELRYLKAQNAILKESIDKNICMTSPSMVHLDKELRRTNRALMVLSGCKEAMIRADDEATLLKDICQIIVNVGGYRLAWIGYIENDELKTVRPVARAGYDAGYVDNLKIALNDPVRGNGPTGISLKTGKPYGSRNVRSDKEMQPWQEEALKRGYLSTLNLPIVYEKKVIGSLAIYSGDVDAFDKEERGLLFELAQTLAFGITVIRDRVRRKKAEAGLRESEERFDFALKAAQEGIWDWNMETDEVYYSPRYKEMLGYSDDEIEPHASAWVRLMHPDDRERALKVVEAVKHGEREYEMEFRMLHKDGHYVEILSRGYPIRRAPGSPVTRIVGTHMDITERKRMAEDLRRARDGLEVRVLERTADLQRSNDELNAQMAERRKVEEALAEARAQAELYLDLMSHDINNMNQVGLGYLEIALQTIKEEGRIEEKDSELLEKPIQSIQDSTRLIENVGKLRSAKSRMHQLQSIDLKEILLCIKEQFSKANGRHITINYEPTESHVRATGLVKDVFTNLVGNAIKHSDSDKPLVIDIVPSRVYGAEESYHKIAIIDNGPGIPDGLKTKIFNRFERGNTKAKGKGLGLYLVKTLVHEFNGKIWVEDRVPGDHTKGARFVVMLPAIEK